MNSRLALPLLVWVCSGCGLFSYTPTESGELNPSDSDCVRLVPSEARTPNAHPRQLEAAWLRSALADLTGPDDTGATAPLLSEAQLATVVEPLSRALARARPDQDVVLAVTGYRSFIGRVLGKRLTSARVFVAQDKLQVIAGQLQVESEHTQRATGHARAVVVGTRSRPIAGSALRGEAWTPAYASRPDWVARRLDDASEGVP